MLISLTMFIMCQISNSRCTYLFFCRIFIFVGCLSVSDRLRRLPEQLLLYGGKRNEVATLWTGS